jgi:putative salt-induced outer membrane protein YdiY
MSRAVMFARAAGTLVLLGLARPALAQDALGAPPPEATKAVTGPKAAAEAPKPPASPDGTTVQLSAGGLSSSGNSRLVAFTTSGAFDWRGGANGVGASIVGNYGRSAPPDGEMKTTTENAQGRLRYDRYVTDDASLFMLVTGRHDKFQGLAFRLNLDPGFKFLFVNLDKTKLWAEAGYDFQYDTRTREGREVRDDMGVLIERLPKRKTDHSARLFLGFKHEFNDKVAVANGIEYLQSFVDGDRYRFNYDVLFTAKVWGDLALGAGFNARYDNQPLPEKVKLDTATTLNVVYAYSNVEKK